MFFTSLVSWFNVMVDRCADNNNNNKRVLARCWAASSSYNVSWHWFFKSLEPSLLIGCSSFQSPCSPASFVPSPFFFFIHWCFDDGDEKCWHIVPKSPTGFRCYIHHQYVQYPRPSTWMGAESFWKNPLPSVMLAKQSPFLEFLFFLYDVEIKNVMRLNTLLGVLFATRPC